MSTGFLAAVLVMLLGAAQLKAKPQETEGKSLLKFDSTFGLIAILLLAMGAGLPFLYSSKRDFFSTDMLIIMIIAAVFIGVGYWTLMVYKNHHVMYDESDIIVTAINRKKQSFTWEEISGLTFNTWTNNYVITLKSGEKIKIYKYLSGSNDFIKKTGKL